MLLDRHNADVAKLPGAVVGKDIIRALFDYLEHHPILDFKRTATDL